MSTTDVPRQRVGVEPASSARSRIPLVVESGMCIGCGACAVAAPEVLTVGINAVGLYEPRLRSGAPLATDPDAVPTRVDAVCPFSDGAVNEDILANEAFGSGPAHPAVGRYEGIWAGHVREGEFRARGSSGGMTSWILVEAMRRDHIDAVMHVHSARDPERGTFSEYTISTTPDAVLDGRGSRYHVQTLEHAMHELRATDGRYAIVGVPCFVKAVRLLARSDPVIAARVALTVSLVCGHLKSTNYTTFLGWSAGVAPGHLRDVDYRHKVVNRPANRYAIAATSDDGEVVVRGVEKIPMSDWGIGLFKPSACDYCDDVLGETADVTVGDAWLPPFMSDWRGANVVVARSALALELLQRGIADGRLECTPWTDDRAAASQEAGIRHRRDGLAIRLAHREAAGLYTPKKRVQPTPDAIDTPLGRRMLLREEIARRSHDAFAEALAAGSLAVFHRAMRPLVQRYYGTRSRTAARRAAAWVLYRTPASIDRVLRRITAGRRFT